MITNKKEVYLTSLQLPTYNVLSIEITEEKYIRQEPECSLGIMRDW